MQRLAWISILTLGLGKPALQPPIIHATPTIEEAFPGRKTIDYGLGATPEHRDANLFDLVRFRLGLVALTCG